MGSGRGRSRRSSTSARGNGIAQAIEAMTAATMRRWFTSEGLSEFSGLPMETVQEGLSQLHGEGKITSELISYCPSCRQVLGRGENEDIFVELCRDCGTRFDIVPIGHPEDELKCMRSPAGDAEIICRYDPSQQWEEEMGGRRGQARLRAATDVEVVRF